MDKLLDEQILQHVTEALHKFFVKDYKKSHENDKVSRPVVFNLSMLLPCCIFILTFLFGSNWNTNKNFRDSCTYYKMKKPTDDDVFCRDLAWPIGNGKSKPVSKLVVVVVTLLSKFKSIKIYWLSVKFDWFK